MAWYDDDPGALEDARLALGIAYPELEWLERFGPPRVGGPINIGEGNAVLDVYQVEIILPPDSPRGLPAVYEVGRKIPRVADRHVSDDGSLCVVLPEAYWMHEPNGLSLVEFIDGPLRSHLAGQSLVAMGRDWPVGEWSHGMLGVVEFYQKQFGVQSLAKIRRLLKLVASDRIKGRWSCPCGSSRRLAACHGGVVKRIRDRVPRSLVLHAVEVLDRAMKARAEQEG